MKSFIKTNSCSDEPVSIFKRLRFGFVGAIIIFIIYSVFFNDIIVMNTQISKANVVATFPNNTAIKKIDVSQGDDIWILDNFNILYHWNAIKKEFIYKVNNVRDFAVGSDDTVVYIRSYYYYSSEIHIRTDINSWKRIDNGNYGHTTISLFDYNTIFTTIGTALVQGSYNNYTRTYGWRYIDSGGYNSYFQVSCAYHDNSLWIIGSNHYVYLYIDNYRKIPRSEVQFKQIKAISKHHAIGIDYNDYLWKYTRGTWTWISTKVKSASMNYDGDIFYVDYNNLIYKF